MSVTEQQIVRLYLGRGIRGEIVEEATDTAAARMELHINLPALQVELEQAMLHFELLPRHCWQPLTTVVGGVPELVWGDDDSLIPTLVPIPHLGTEDATSGGGTTVIPEEE